MISSPESSKNGSFLRRTSLLASTISFMTSRRRDHLPADLSRYLAKVKVTSCLHGKISPAIDRPCQFISGLPPDSPMRRRLFSGYRIRLRNLKRMASSQAQVLDMTSLDAILGGVARPVVLHRPGCGATRCRTVDAHPVIRHSPENTAGLADVFLLASGRRVGQPTDWQPRQTGG